MEFSRDLLGGRGKKGAFRYAPLIGPDILSGILARAAGKPVLEFAQENLFHPLGIQVENNLSFKNKEEQMAFNQSVDISGWVTDAAGTHAAGWGLTLTAMDMAKIGQLYLNGGIWEDRQIISAEWIAKARQNTAGGKRGTCLTDICGGSLRMAMQRWEMAAMLFMPIQRKSWQFLWQHFLRHEPGTESG